MRKHYWVISCPAEDAAYLLGRTGDDPAGVAASASICTRGVRIQKENG